MKLKSVIMFVSKVIKFLRNWQQSYRGVRELSQLNDQELADLGLIRSDISRVAHESSQHHGSRFMTECDP
jgi:uncharacterized protein YjiS (DUF1127 family)